MRSVATIDARDGAPLSPGTARASAPPDLDFSRRIRPGSAVAVRAGILRIQNADLTFDFRGAAPMPWRDGQNDGQDKPQYNQKRFSTGWFDAWSSFVYTPEPAGFAAALVADEERSAFNRALVRRVRTHVPELMHASVVADLPVAWASLQQLLGMGPGLTPSGDDFATGYILGFGQVSRKPDRIEFLQGLTQAARNRSRNSTDVSRAYLEHAGAGRFSVPLTALVEAIMSHAGNLPARLAGVFRLGHSSGRDAAFGILCGLAVGAPELCAHVVTKLDNPYLQEKIPR
ncbi:MAG: DUF2877 domain-containing protein [Alphaproteobacteria bacterium]